MRFWRGGVPKNLKKLMLKSTNNSHGFIFFYEAEEQINVTVLYILHFALKIKKSFFMIDYLVFQQQNCHCEFNISVFYTKPWNSIAIKNLKFKEGNINVDVVKTSGISMGAWNLLFWLYVGYSFLKCNLLHTQNLKDILCQSYNIAPPTPTIPLIWANFFNVCVRGGS